MNMNEKIKQMPKTELHLHLDGSVGIETAKRLSGKTEEEVRSLMVAPDKCEDLVEYLTKFDFPISLMQSKENLTTIAKEVADNLAKQNVMYAEIRFAPMFHTREGLSYSEVVESVLEGLRQNDKIKTNLILCMMRGMSDEENIKTLKIAEQYLGKGVCAIDLAGDEAHNPVENYAQFFRKAKELGVPYTIHSGEAGPASEVRRSIELGATRIGHGIHCVEDTDVEKLARDSRVLLEVCPTSNVQTNAISDYSAHPLREFYDSGIMVSVNTDNSTVSNVSLTEEYEKLQKHFGFTEKEFEQMNMYALDRAFVSPEERAKLKAEYKARMATLEEPAHEDR